MKQSWKKLVAVLLTVTMLGAGRMRTGSSGPADGDSAKDAPKTESTPDAAENDNADAKAGKNPSRIRLKWLFPENRAGRALAKELDGCEAAAKDLNVELIYQVANGDADPGFRLKT